jgi:hypothetical protein
MQRLGIIGQIKERLEPSVPSTTIVNDGSIFVMMGCWYATTSKSNSISPVFSQLICAPLPAAVLCRKPDCLQCHLEGLPAHWAAGQRQTARPNSAWVWPLHHMQTFEDHTSSRLIDIFSAGRLGKRRQRTRRCQWARR